MPRNLKADAVEAHIRRVVGRIVKKFNPEKIILFGSRARGDARPDSDVDLLVVMEFEGSRLDLMVELQGTVDPVVVHTDILVSAPDEFAWRKAVVGTIEWPASQEGKVLYARS